MERSFTKLPGCWYLPAGPKKDFPWLAQAVKTPRDIGAEKLWVVENHARAELV